MGPKTQKCFLVSENRTFILREKVAFLGNLAVLRDVLVYVNPKFNLESNGDGLKEPRGFLITNLLTQNVSGVVHSGSSAVQRECLIKSTQNLTKSRMLTG